MAYFVHYMCMILFLLEKLMYEEFCKEKMTLRKEIYKVS